LHSLLEYPLWYGPFQMAVVLCVVILWQTHPQRSGVPGVSHLAQAPLLAVPKPFVVPWVDIPKKNSPFVQTTIALLAILITAFSGYALWDYHRISQIYQVPSERSAAYRYNTLDKIRDSRLFQNHVQFAELTTTAITPENAVYVHAQAQRLLHFSPEARVVEKLIDSAVVLNLDAEAAFYKLRYQAAFPESFARWEAKVPLR
jgi:hypothetical protein